MAADTSRSLRLRVVMLQSGVPLITIRFYSCPSRITERRAAVAPAGAERITGPRERRRKGFRGTKSPDLVRLSCTVLGAGGQEAPQRYLSSAPCGGAPVSGISPAKLAESVKTMRSVFVAKNRLPENPGRRGSAVKEYRSRSSSPVQDRYSRLRGVPVNTNW